MWKHTGDTLYKYRCTHCNSVTILGMLKCCVWKYFLSQQFWNLAHHPLPCDTPAGVLLQWVATQLPPGRKRMAYQCSTWFQFHHSEPCENKAWFSPFLVSLNLINYNCAWKPGTSLYHVIKQNSLCSTVSSPIRWRKRVSLLSVG